VLRRLQAQQPSTALIRLASAVNAAARAGVSFKNFRSFGSPPSAKHANPVRLIFSAINAVVTRTRKTIFATYARSMTSVAGVDGCRAGWVVVHDGDAAVHSHFTAVLEALPDDAVVAVDMPIGLPGRHVPGGRAVDRAARSQLGPKRSSVFSPPPRCVLGARTLAEARRRGGRLTLQTLNLLPRIEDVDRVMTVELQRRVFEVHPELSFAVMNGEQPVLAPKRSGAGSRIRRALLTRAGVRAPARPTGAALDDLLDACALSWSARRIAEGTARRIPDAPTRDERGLRMELWW
jgi:predicted RNase H-like nuclease